MSPGEVEAGGSIVQGHPLLQSEFEAGMDDRRPCLTERWDGTVAIVQAPIAQNQAPVYTRYLSAGSVRTGQSLGFLAQPAEQNL